MASAPRSWQERMRERIKTAGYMTLLEDFAFGRSDLTRDQLTAILAMVDRILPKLSATTVTVEDNRKDPRNMTFAELQQEWDDKPEANTEH
jgi:hypothetical protein